MSCRYHRCELHKREKVDNDCFPVALPRNPNNRPYEVQDVIGYVLHHWYESLGVAEFKFNMHVYRQVIDASWHAERTQRLIEIQKQRKSTSKHTEQPEEWTSELEIEELKEEVNEAF